jgi:hypothetical protein
MRELPESKPKHNNIYSVEVIDNGFVVTYSRLLSEQKYAFHTFEGLVNHLARCFNLVEIGEIVSVMGSRDKK